MVDIKDLKIAHFGNLANDAFPIVQALRDRQIDADLYVLFNNDTYLRRKRSFLSQPLWKRCLG